MPNISDRIGSENVIKVLSRSSAASYAKLIHLTDVNTQLQDKDGMILVWDLGSQTFIMTSVIDTYTQSTIPSNGALVVNGGVGIGRNLNVGESLVVSGISTFNSNIDINSSVDIQNKLTVGTLGVSGLTTTKNLQVIGVATIGNIKIDTNTIFTTTGNLILNSSGGTTQIDDALYINDSTQSTTKDTGALIVDGGVGIEKNLNVGGSVDIDLDLNVDGGDITTNLTSFNLLNVTTTNINFAGAATALMIGATTGIATIRNATLDLDGDLNVDGGDITTNLTAFNLLNATATNLNFAGAATALVIGATSGIATIRNATLDLDGNLNIDGGDVTSNTAALNLFNANVTTANVLGAATALVIGATSGVTTIRNSTLSVPNATTLNLGATSSATSVTFPSTPNTSFVAIAATTNATTTTSGALRVAGGVGIVSDVYIGGILNVTGSQTGTNLTLTGNLQVNGNTTLGNSSGDVVTITGSVNHTGPLTNVGGVTIDNIGISSNVISTRSGGGNILYIDPYPDGLSNEGMVVIKGDLQVDGTTTTVNSSNVTVNDAILSLGEVTSVRTVVATVASGVSTISLDSVVGINTGDIITGNAALPNSGLTTITAYNTSTKIITITGTTSSGISTTSQLTVIHAYDTNTDRGISFDYNTGVGTANNKTGFFGYHDTTNSGSAAPVRSWTYVPDATNSNNVITGTRGYLDIKGIYYQTGDFNTHGVVFFDNDGLQTSTNNPSTASSTRTSTQILTAVTEINLSLPSSTSVTAGDQVTQVNNSGAYGVVKTTVSGTTITLIGVQGTFDTTNDLKVNGANISIIPGTVTTIYTNKPMWTDTLDGGTF